MRCKHIISSFSLRNASFAKRRRAKKLPIRTGSFAADHAHLKKRAGEARLRNFNSPWSSAPGNRMNRARALGVVDCEEGCETLSKKCCQPPRARFSLKCCQPPARGQPSRRPSFIKSLSVRELQPMCGVANGSPPWPKSSCFAARSGGPHNPLF